MLNYLSAVALCAVSTGLIIWQGQRFVTEELCEKRKAFTNVFLPLSIASYLLQNFKFDIIIFRWLIVCGMIILVPAAISRIYFKSFLKRAPAGFISLTLTCLSIVWAVIIYYLLGGTYYDQHVADFILPISFGMASYRILTHDDVCKATDQSLNSQIKTPQSIPNKESEDDVENASQQHIDSNNPSWNSGKTTKDEIAINIEDLRTLKELHDNCIITDEEYEKKKKQILGI